MADVIDMGEERDKRFGPDAEFVMRDDMGRKMFTYLLSYEHGGKTWSVQVWAYDDEDANQRVIAMRQTMALDGKLYSEIPV